MICLWVEKGTQQSRKSKESFLPTVWLPRFLILQTRWVALPVTPVTYLSASVMSNHGPEREPVGFGVALSYSLSRSPLFEDRQRCAG